MTTAFVFPGQGSQKVGMLDTFYTASDAFKATFDEAQTVLGYNVWSLIQEGPQEQLNMTEITQPVLLASSVALWRVWQEKGGEQPTFMAGHSLGEWSALVCADVVSFADALNLVRMRGKFMQEAVPQGVGAMAAIIGLSDAQVEQACAAASQGDEVVSPVNYNSPGQLVIAGVAAAVERAMALCKEAGAKRALPLPVSAPFHTALMQPAADRLAAEIEKTVFSVPAVPIVHNVHAKTEQDPAAIKAIMIEQIYSPVKWVSCVQALVDEGVDTLIECGPGKVLSGLAKRIHKPLVAKPTETLEALNAAIENNS